MWGHRSTDRRKKVVAVNCTAAMDIVFIIDYTDSMSGDINMVKNSIASLLQTIEIESNNDYRLSLILFDEYSSTYINKPAYTSLPADQRIVQGNVYITVLNKLSQNNYAETIEKLNILTTTEFPLGNGRGLPEPSDYAVRRVLFDNIAGTFRDGVNKAIIIFTDNGPSGLDDYYTVQEDFIEMMNLSKLSRDNGVTISINDIHGIDSQSYNNVFKTTSLITKGVYSTGSNIQIIKDMISNMCSNVASQKPVVSTTSVTNITSAGWTVSGNVTSQGSSPVTERGFLYSINSTNIVEGAPGVIKIINGSGTGIYTSNVSQTIPNGQTYYVRSFAKSLAGISYGDKLRASTTPATAPTVELNSVNLSGNILFASGTISTDGGSTLTERGFIYSTSNNNLTIGQVGVTKVIVPGLFANYNTQQTVSGTNFFVRSYAINSIGTSYSGILSTTPSTHFWVILNTSDIMTENLVNDCGGLLTLVGTRQTMDFTAYYYDNPQATIPKTLTSSDITLKEQQFGDYAYEYTYLLNVSGTTTIIADDFEISYNVADDYCSEGMSYYPGYYNKTLNIIPSSEYSVIDEGLGMVQGFARQSQTSTSITVSWSSVPAGCNKVKIYGNNNVVLAEVLLTGSNPNGPGSYTITGLTPDITQLAIAGVTSNNYHTKATEPINLLQQGNSGSLYVEFSKSGGCGTQTTYINGTLVNTLLSSGTFDGTLNTGETFYVRITVTGKRCVGTTYNLKITSSTRGVLYNASPSGTQQSPQFTRQAGEDFTVYVTPQI